MTKNAIEAEIEEANTRAQLGRLQRLLDGLARKMEAYRLPPEPELDEGARTLRAWDEGALTLRAWDPDRVALWPEPRSLGKRIATGARRLGATFLAVAPPAGATLLACVAGALVLDGPTMTQQAIGWALLVPPVVFMLWSMGEQPER